ncbi:MAG TPA: L-threonylcarbamoyladenylate synthase [Pyrinomonadaceae bacterium]|nr:L-threonylcarbamoyladenylate synthase [Pyrinomonadaceae bacterium]
MKASEVISSGGVIAFRTDTFYGLGADPFNQAAVTRIRELKGREDNKPILLLISDLDQVHRLLRARSDEFNSAARKFWPGPLTIVDVAVTELPEEITSGTGTVGVRLPADEIVREFVRECGGVLTATSANPSGCEPARSARQVTGYFPVGLDLIIDGGEVSATEPSTVLDVSSSPPRVVREGAISQDVIEQLFAEYD